MRAFEAWNIGARYMNNDIVVASKDAESDFPLRHTSAYHLKPSFLRMRRMPEQLHAPEYIFNSGITANLGEGLEALGAISEFLQRI